LTLSFTPGSREDFIKALHRRAPAFYDQFNVRYHVEGRDGDAMKKSGRWIGYAIRALVVRFWDLAKVNFPMTQPNTILTLPRKPILSTFFLSCWDIS
jgi:hypothetical protein